MALLVYRALQGPVHGPVHLAGPALITKVYKPAGPPRPGRLGRPV